MALFKLVSSADETKKIRGVVDPDFSIPSLLSISKSPGLEGTESDGLEVKRRGLGQKGLSEHLAVTLQATRRHSMV